MSSRRDNNDNLNHKKKCRVEYENNLELYRAALSNDWIEAEKIYNRTVIGYGSIITSRGETALHVAALAGHTKFVEKLIPKMSDTDVRIQTLEQENTALHFAATSGNVKIAKAIMKDRRTDLALVNNKGGLFPIDVAAAKGYREMVSYLYQHTLPAPLHSPPTNQYEDHNRLFLALINSDIYDVALDLAKRFFVGDRAPNSVEEEALQLLARKPLTPFLDAEPFLKRWNDSFRRHEYFKKIHARMNKRHMYKNGIALIRLLWESLASDEEKVEKLNGRGDSFILEAAKHGSYEFLSIVIATHPDILFTCDDEGYSIFHHAILNRHVDIFKLVQINLFKSIVTKYRDNDGNIINMLPMAAKLAPPNRLNIVPGAALQLQLELLWFEEVKRMVDLDDVNKKSIPYTQICNTHKNFRRMKKLFQEMDQLIDQFHFFKKTYQFHFFENLENTIKNYKEMNQVYPPNNKTSAESLYEEMKEKYKQFEELNHPDDYTPYALSEVQSLFKKMVDSENRQSDVTLKLLEFFQEIEKKTKKLNTVVLFFEKLNKVMKRHRSDGRHPGNMGVMMLWFKEMEIVMKQHESIQDNDFTEEYIPCDTPLLRLLLLVEEMKKLIEQHKLDQNNNLTEELTPHEAFVKEHKYLMAEGEKWMRDTANSCMIVAALITTIAFAAAITIPGGLADNGYPNFLSEPHFKIFAVADSISMIFSATSLLDFLSILTARYTMDSFLWSLPTKLFIGLITLFVSIAAMMLAFVLSIFIIFKDSPLVFAVLIAAGSALPIILFIWQHGRLLFDAIRTTYNSYFLFKSGKVPYLLINEGKKERKSLLPVRACGKVLEDLCP